MVTDLRLWLKDAIAETIAGLHDLQIALVELATENRRVVMPGYTHLQRAQPVLLAHHLLAYFEMFERDIGRFADCYARTDVMPLGSRRAGRRAVSNRPRDGGARARVLRRSRRTASTPSPTATS